MRTLLTPLLLIPLLLACSEEECAPMEPTPVEASAYLPTAIGNQWIYERYTVSEDGSESLSGTDTLTLDSTFVSNGNMYYHFDATNPLIAQASVRDSAGFLVSPSGAIVLSNTIFDEVFYSNEVLDPVQYTTATYMASEESVRVVGAGTFTCLDRISEINTDDENVAANYPKFDSSSYSANVGLVNIRRNFFTGNSFLEFRLLDYNIE